MLKFEAGKVQEVPQEEEEEEDQPEPDIVAERVKVSKAFWSGITAITQPLPNQK